MLERLLERIRRPEEVVPDDAPDQEWVKPQPKLEAPRCRVGSKGDNPCWREAVVWDEDHRYGMCL